MLTAENQKIIKRNVNAFVPAPLTKIQITDPGESHYIATGKMKRFGNLVDVEVSVKKETLDPVYWSILDDFIMFDMQNMGEITLNSAVVVSDPIYARDVWCRTTLTNVRPGQWEIVVALDKIDSWGKRLYILELWHKGTPRPESPDWVERFNLGVDSAKMSVFDDAHYRRKNGSIEEYEADNEAKELFNNKCYELTDNNDRCGVFTHDGNAVGFVCSSGIGDGSYLLRTIEQDGETIAMMINFM